MPDLSRREVILTTATLAGSTLIATSVEADEPKKEIPKTTTDRERVIAAGMTEAEADCWELTAKAAGKFFELPKLHPMDDHEVAHAIHVIQNKLLGRPTYRKYLEIAKRDAGKEKDKK